MTTMVRVTPEWLEQRRTPHAPAARLRDAVLLLPPGLVERRTIRSVPRVRVAVLRRVVAANAERYFPLEAGDVETTAEWCTDENGEPFARAYAATFQTIEAVVRTAKERALWVDDIRPEGAGRGATLMPVALRRGRARSLQRHMLWSLSVVACVATGALEVARIGLERQRARHHGVDTPRVATARRNLASLQEAGAEQRMAWADRKATERMLGLVAGIGRALEGGFVTSLQLKEGHIEEVALATPMPAAVADAIHRLQPKPVLRYAAAPTLEARDSALWSRLTLAARSRQ